MNGAGENDGTVATSAANGPMQLSPEAGLSTLPRPVDSGRALEAMRRNERLATLKPNDDRYPPSIFFKGMKFMLYGDPSLAMGAAK